MNVVVLPSARERDAQANLDAFVAKGRASRAFGDVDFDDPVWRGVVLSKAKRITSGATGPKDLHFLVGGGARGAEDLGPLPPPFSDFVKALLRLREDARPQHVENHRVMLRAARHLHGLLKREGFDPCLLLPRHFDEAARRARAAETPATAYATGKFLAEIVTWLNEHGITLVRVHWRNTIPRPSSDDRVGEEAAKRREDKLPSEAALEALPQIANLLGDEADEADLLRMRTVELLVCGGWRINELLTIPADCEVTEGTEGEPDYRFGIRYFAEKGFGPTIKWIPSPMVSVAQRAISDIRRITQPVRNDAVYIHENPGRHPLPILQGNVDELVGIGELARALGLASRDAAGFCKSRGIVLAARGKARRGDAVRALLNDMPVVPEDFPLQLHQLMFLVRDNAMHAQRGTIQGSVRVLVWSMLSGFLTGSKGVRTVFEKFGFTERDGSRISVTTHAFRHWLNTLAQEGGMSQELIARWSGRKDMSQNAAYDHVTGAQLAKKVRGMVETGTLIGQLARVRDSLPPVDRDAFLATQVATGHVTDIGTCIHDWQLAPLSSPRGLRHLWRAHHREEQPRSTHRGREADF